MLRLDQIDLSELADLLDQRDYNAGYLNPESGEVFPSMDPFLTGVDEDELYGGADVEDLIPLGGEGGQRVGRDMEIFAAEVGDRRLRRQLRDALEGPRPMRTFRDVVYSASDEIRQGWCGFSCIRAQLRALDFLGITTFTGEQLVAQAELDERHEALVKKGDALLDSLHGESGARLILLNGLPGVGKSTLAREYVAARPGVLCLDIDVLRTMLGGSWEETAELGRSLALQVIEAHLDSGHDVVVPQLVARPDQLTRFEAAAADFDFVLVHVQGAPKGGSERWQQATPPDELRWYDDKLTRLIRDRPDALTLSVVDGDPAATAAALADLLERD